VRPYSNLPATHCVHADLPVRDVYQPAGQPGQVLITPDGAEYVPAKHAVRVVASEPAVGHLQPAGQAPHVADVATPAALNRPAVQRLHAVWPSSYWPPLHREHALFPVVPAAIQPSGHDLHAVSIPVG